MSAQFKITDILGNKMIPSTESVNITENGNAVQNISINCPTGTQGLAASLIITVDISASMNLPTFNLKTIDIVKSSLNNLISTFPNSQFECAITTFNDNAFLAQDFSIDKPKLKKAVNSFSPFGGTNYDAGLFNPPIGAIQLAKKAKYKPTIIFITDGLSNLLSADSILINAKILGCTIHIISLGLLTSKELEGLADSTGGTVFNSVTSLREFELILFKLYAESVNGTPCVVKWESTIECEFGKKEVAFEHKQLSNIKEYVSTKIIDKAFNISPVKLEMGFKGLGFACTYFCTTFNRIRGIGTDSFGKRIYQSRFSGYSGNNNPNIIFW